MFLFLRLMKLYKKGVAAMESAEHADVTAYKLYFSVNFSTKYYVIFLLR